MWIRFATFVLWLAVGASAVAWIMPWMTPKVEPTPGLDVPGRVAPAVPPADWSPLLIGAPAAPERAQGGTEDSRFRLVGVAGPLRASGQGVALLSIDGQPPRAFRPGQAVDDAHEVIEVTANTVKIGPRGGPASLVLQAPLLPPPATGVPVGSRPAPA